jgi:hypothetical protein
MCLLEMINATCEKFLFNEDLFIYLQQNLCYIVWSYVSLLMKFLDGCCHCAEVNGNMVTYFGDCCISVKDLVSAFTGVYHLSLS